MKSVRVKRVDINYIVVEYEQIIDIEINKQVTCLTNNLRKLDREGVNSIIPTYCSVLIEYDPLVLEFENLLEYINEILNSNNEVESELGRTFNIPVLYGYEKGPDLLEVAKINNMSVEEVITIHTSEVYKVYMIGFNPGYPYLGGLDKRIATPRLDEPRVRVPAGSVAIGGEQTGIYSTDSPGGWRLIGHTPIPLFDPTSNEPVLLKAGDNVKFISIDEHEYKRIKEEIDKGKYSIDIVLENYHE
jgi:KipI family sensor histidine kinase inhibitor